jgi:hypothetical protein
VVGTRSPASVVSKVARLEALVFLEWLLIPCPAISRGGSLPRTAAYPTRRDGYAAVPAAAGSLSRVSHDVRVQWIRGPRHRRPAPVRADLIGR